MKNPFKIIKYFFIYRKQILKHKKYLETNFGLNIDNIYRLWTVADFSAAPDEIIKKMGIEAINEVELKKFIQKFNKDLNFLELNELINIYEIKQIDKSMFGITLGYSLYNNLYLFLWFIAIIISILTLLSILIFL